MREVRRSFGSLGFRKAKAIAAIYAVRLTEVFQTVRTNDISRDDAAAAVRQCFRDLIEQRESAGGYVPETANVDLEIAEQRAMALEQIASLKGEISSRNFSVSTWQRARSIISTYSDEVAPSSARMIDLQEGVARALIEEQRLFLLRLVDRLSSFSPRDDFFGADVGRVQLTSQKLCEPRKLAGPTVGETVELYLDAGRRKWVAKTLAARRWQLRYLEEHLGSATRLASVGPHDIRAYRDKILQLRRNHGRSPRQSFSEKQSNNLSFRIAPKTAALIFEPCKAMFRWAKSHEGMIDNNPAEDIRLEVPKGKKGSEKSRRPFKASELITLFSSSIFTGCASKHRRYEPGEVRIKDGKFWIPILGFYTGARLGELVQLHVSDVQLNGPVPFLSFNEDNADIQDAADRKHIKSEAGIRRVPLHPDILELGFAELMIGRKGLKKNSTRLFPEFPYGSDGQASTVASKWFARAMDKVGLPDPTLVFHSFRHLAEDLFRNAKQPQYLIDRVLGHSDGATSSIYGEGVSLETMREAIVSAYEDVSLVEIVAPHRNSGKGL